MSETRTRVYAYVKNDRKFLESCENSALWTGSTDVSAITTSTNHREGSISLSFAKSGTTQAYGQVAKILDADSQIDLVDFIRGKLRFWINLSDLTNIANVQLVIGEDATNNYVYQVADTTLSTGWNEVSVSIDSPTSTGGDGAAWSSIGYIAIKVNFDAVGNTLTAILVDAISAIYEINTTVESINVTGSGLATSAKQDLQITQETAIATSLAIMDDWDESDRAKVNIIVGQAGVAAGSGVNGVTVQRVTVATDDPVSQMAASKYITGIGHGVKTVTTAFTDEALAGSTACKRIIIQAQTDNTGKIAVGASGVDATIATGTGVILDPGDVVELDIDNLADVFIDATISTDGVRYTYFT